MKTSIKVARNNNSQKISIIGSGAWGFGLANLITSNGHKISILCQSSESLESAKKNINNLSTRLTTDPHSIVTDNFIFIVTPSNVVLSIIKLLSTNHISAKSTIIICSKGIDDENLQLFSSCIEALLPKNRYAILSGPNFAEEVSQSLPTMTTIASKNKTTSNQISKLLRRQSFLPIISNEVVSTQIFGAIKNILAIGCGLIDGLELGENAKAALIIKGSVEACALIKKLGGDPIKNFISPAGLGDLFLTCSSKKSRNNSLGYMIGCGENINDIIKKGLTYEGFRASNSMVKFATKYQTTLPLCEKINQILQNSFTIEEIKELISKAILSK